MNTHLKNYNFGKVRIELTIQESDGCQMLLTAKSRDNRTLWKTFVTDEYGHTKTYHTLAEALKDVDTRMKALI